MPRLLELFSGTQSMSKVFRAKGWEAVTLDMDARSCPDICKNILHVLPSDLPNHVAAAWASPMCIQASLARTRANTPRVLVGADKLVRRAIEIAG